MEGVKSFSPKLVERYRKVWLGITIIDAFERSCDIIPDKVALIDGGTRLTFAQLREKALSAALALFKLGLGKGSIVLLQIPNYAEAVYVYLGLHMIGAIPVLCLPRQGGHGNGHSGPPRRGTPTRQRRFMLKPHSQPIP